MREVSRSGAALAAVLAGCTLLAEPTAAELPPPNRCPLLGAAPDASGEDAIPAPLAEGSVIGWSHLPRLQQLLPIEIWRLRDVFFHDGMRMEIGACHRRYPAPGFYARATAEFAGRARVDERANLSHYVAGLPFPPEAIDSKAGDPGARWAWNFEQRYRGAGPAGRFRIVDMPTRTGGTFNYRGSFFFFVTRHRADLTESGYAVPEAGENVWISGGRFEEPFNARHLAWRQLRPVETLRKYTEPDDTFVYVPTMRRMRRSSTAWVDGIYTPRYRVGGDPGGGGIAIGGGRYTGARGSIQPTAGESTAVTENLRRGFTGLAVRPNAYVWRVLDEREVLAPLNATRAGYPLEKERNYGPSGLSLGSDRWDVRYAVILRGDRLDRGGDFQTLILWLDYQTQQPLYLVTKRKGGRLVDIAILAHRFSGDLATYPPWPNGEQAYVFDPVAAVAYAPEDGSGWRRESYDVVSVPPDPEAIRRYVSTDFLARGK